jgi:hypothetical protein
MFAKLSYLVNAKPDHFFSDFKNVLTGTTSLNSLSSTCNKAASEIVGGAGAWIYEATGFYDAYSLSSTLGVGYSLGLLWCGGSINKWFACGESGIKSSTDGVNWVSVNATATRTMGFNGATIVALPNSATTALYSTDGVNFSTATGSLAAPSGTAASVAALNNGVFVYVGGATANTAYISTNGSAWTFITLPTGTYYGICVAGSGTGIKFVAVGTNVCATSATGLASSWTAQTIPTGSYYAVAYNSTSGTCMAVGSYVTATSNSTFTTWTAQSTNVLASQIIWNGEAFIAVFQQYRTTTRNYINVTKNNGVSWQQRMVSTAGIGSIAYSNNSGGMETSTGFLITNSAWYVNGLYYTLCESLKVDKNKTNGVFKLLVDGTHYCPVHIDFTAYYNNLDAEPSNGYISSCRIGELAFKVYESWSSGSGLNLCTNSDSFRYKLNFDIANISALYFQTDSSGLRAITYLQQDNRWGYCHYNDGSVTSQYGSIGVEIYTREDDWNITGVYPTWGFRAGRYPLQLQVPRIRHSLTSDATNYTLTVNTAFNGTAGYQIIDKNNNPSDFVLRQNVYSAGSYRILGGYLGDGVVFGRNSMGTNGDILTQDYDVLAPMIASLNAEKTQLSDLGLSTTNISATIDSLQALGIKKARSTYFICVCDSLINERLLFLKSTVLL